MINMVNYGDNLYIKMGLCNEQVHAINGVITDLWLVKGHKWS